MSPPLTVARKYSSFHVCGSKEMSFWIAEMVVAMVMVVVGIGPGLYRSFLCPSCFCPDCREEEDQHNVRSLLTKIYVSGLHVILKIGVSKISLK